jgi:hypothetical protein
MRFKVASLSGQVVSLREAVSRLHKSSYATVVQYFFSSKFKHKQFTDIIR